MPETKAAATAKPGDLIRVTSVSGQEDEPWLKPGMTGVVAAVYGRALAIEGWDVALHPDDRYEVLAGADVESRSA